MFLANHFCLGSGKTLPDHLQSPRSLNVVESRISRASFAVPLTCSAMSGGSSVEALDQVHQPLPEQLRRTHTGRICANFQRPDPPRPVTNPRFVFRKNTQSFLKPVHIVHTIGWIREALRSAHRTVSAPPSRIARKNMGHPSPDTTTVSVSHTDFMVPDAVRNKQHQLVPDAVERGMEDVSCVFLHKQMQTLTLCGGCTLRLE